MKILTLWRNGAKKPFGLFGLDNEGKLFGRGIDGEYWIDNLFDKGVVDDDGKRFTEKDGGKFLEAIAEYIERGINEDEVILLGPNDVDKEPELEDLDIEDDSERHIEEEKSNFEI